GQRLKVRIDAGQETEGPFEIIADLGAADRAGAIGAERLSHDGAGAEVRGRSAVPGAADIHADMKAAPVLPGCEVWGKARPQARVERPGGTWNRRQRQRSRRRDGGDRYAAEQREPQQRRHKSPPSLMKE